jgi:hypothetical protein
MERWDRRLYVGRLAFAMAMAGFGVQYAICAGGMAAAPRVAAPWICGPAYIAWVVTGAFLLVAASIATAKFARGVLAASGVVLLLYVVINYFPRILTHPRNPGPWTNGFEVLSIAGGCWILARSYSGDWSRAVERMAEAGRFLFAVSLAVFATQHFMYARFVASLVCAWIPWHLFWAYFTGAAFAAAALSVATRIMMRLSTVLLGTMFFLWVVLLHAPRVAGALGNGDEWTSAFVAMAMSGLAFALAGEAPGGLSHRERMKISALDR